MRDIDLFDRLWSEAYARERAVIEEAQRIAGRDPVLACDPYALFATARRRVADAAAFERGIAGDPVARRARRVRAMTRLLETPPCTGTRGQAHAARFASQAGLRLFR